MIDTEQFQLGDHVRIRKKDIAGEIIDISPPHKDGKIWYVVEKDEQGYTDDPDAYRVEGRELYDCTADQLEKL